MHYPPVYYAMKQILLIFPVMLLFSSLSANAQEDVRVLHRKLKTEIEKSYKSKAITENEYNKMMEEYSVISKTVEIAMVDGFLSPDEKNKILGKINRSKKRLIRYKNNNEVY